MSSSFEIVDCESCGNPTPVPPSCKTCGRKICGPCIRDDRCAACEKESGGSAAGQPIKSTPRNLMIEIDVKSAASVNYASWQNSVPILQSLQLKNKGSASLANLSLTLNSTPSVLVPHEWMIDRLSPQSEVSLRKLDVKLDPSYLETLNESERSQLTFILREGNNVLSKYETEIRVLARDEWGGISSGTELVAAHVMPNDPVIPSILKKASEILAKSGQNSALNGYQDNDIRRSYMMTAAIWSAIATKKITYANPPRSFEQVGQKVRHPHKIFQEGLATCLDSTLLFAASIEAIGLNPVIIFTQGHCFAGVWLTEKTFGKVNELDCSEIRKAIAARELITFETTLVTGENASRFEDAVTNAKAATTEEKEDQFIVASDVTRARMSQILPLASHHANKQNGTTDTSEANVPLPSSDTLPAESLRELPDKPSTPEGRIDRWQRKLLDLSLRNRLLNFRATKQTIPIFCPDIPLLEDLLADGKRLRLISLVDHDPVGARDSDTHRERTNKDIEAEFAKQALSQGDVCANLSEADLNGRLTTLYRSVRNDLSEGGSNTLFLAVGFLKWKQKADDVKSYRAPLILVPVKLIRRSALSPFLLELHEDEVRFNATLIQLLKKDFGKDISVFENELPEDDSGVDVPLILDHVRREVRDIPGFEVMDETALGSFSFSKYLMWKDLVDRIESLKKNRVVRHLIDNPDKPFESSGGGIPKPKQIDARYQPKDIIHPLPADSSQLAAVMAASEGNDFVLVGPPGTGKSQTIANVIAQCLANQKTVLFVAEKTAALDVVHRRLKQNGLGDCCLELHSNKAERRKFLSQLEASWEKNKRNSNEWASITGRLLSRRDQLNQYVDALHQEYPNGWTPFRALGHSVQNINAELLQFDWPIGEQHSAEQYSRLFKVAEQLSDYFSAVHDIPKLTSVTKTEWSNAWESELLRECRAVLDAAANLKSSLSQLSELLKLGELTKPSMCQLIDLKQLANSIVEARGVNAQILFDKGFPSFPQEVALVKELINSYQSTMKSCSGDYSASLDDIPVAVLDKQLRDAISSFFPVSWFKKRKLKKLLQSYASSGDAHPQDDISRIKTLQELKQQVESSLLKGKSIHFDAFNTDIAALEHQVMVANRLRNALVVTGKMLTNATVLNKAVLPLISGDDRDSDVWSTLAEFSTSIDRFIESADRYRATAGGEVVANHDQDALVMADEAVRHIVENQKSLQKWTAWCKIRSIANSVGLDGLTEALTQGAVNHQDAKRLFLSSYADWWVRGVIDSDETLRSFQKFQHELAIDDFRKLDDEARIAAPVQAQQSIAHGLPTHGFTKKSELGLLKHQLGLKRPSKSIRQMITAMPEHFNRLAPCLLMSPLSIAQYLPANQALFDVVIFDEASQITTWDAVGAIARGKQTIIVGDPKQLPPTNFFGRADDDAENDEIEDHEKDLESILDEAKASGLPTLQLNWHYRSKDESLITFSNWNYYGNKLVTFPSSNSEGTGVSLRYLPTALYDRGKSRTNRDEADAIVSELVTRMKRNLKQPPSKRLTFGVITFNSQQQSLIQDLLDQAQRDYPELDWFFSDDRIEPTIVKNLENVQGDERDVMLFSITFGRDVAGKAIPLTFGALNRDGGERRLNVAVTRSRQELVVFSSFRGDELNAERSKARGVRDLKSFLDYAEKGPQSLDSHTEGSVGGFDSPFEEAVAEELENKGWEVVPQVGVSGFRIDLGIKHPSKPGAYLAGVECDGATYHRSAIARDRDKTRQMVLENLGWNIIRIWSPDWWYDKSNALEKVDSQLRELVDQDAVTVVEAHQLEDVGSTFEHFEQHGLEANQDQFFEESYDEQLSLVIKEMISKEYPIREDVLAKQVAKAHGYGRTGAKIRDRIMSLVGDVHTSTDSAGRFIWGDVAPSAIIAYRAGCDEEARRSADEISIPELAGILQADESFLNEPDPTDSIARFMGIIRLSKMARFRIDEMIDYYKNLSDR